MTQRKPERLNSYISTKEMKRTNKKFTSLELSGPEISYIWVPSTCNKQIITILQNYAEYRQWKNLLNSLFMSLELSCCETQSRTVQRKLQANIIYEHECKNPKNIKKLIIA